MSGWRHDSAGAAIDRSKPLSFQFDGQTFSGFEGDTLASALLASGARILGRSFKYHRPRGLWGMGADEPNALLDVTQGGATTPNLRATTTPLRGGMSARSVNAAPTAARDRNRVLDLAHRFLPAGFYYKTFMTPGWMRWEPMIRRMAGLGRLDGRHAPAPHHPQISAACDVLVIGAGAAGLAAALSAVRAGRQVWLVDDASEPGGALRWRGGRIDGQEWSDYAAETVAAVRAGGGRVLVNTTVWGAFDHGLFTAWRRRDGAADEHWRIRAAEVVLAAGAIERPLCFANNDLPGVMSAEAALHHLALFGAVAGRKIVLATANDASYPVADALANAGAQVTLVDARAETPQIGGVRHLKNQRLTGAEGKREVTAAMVGAERIEADTILVSGGYTPSVHLWRQAGGKLDWDEERDALVPRQDGAAAMSAVMKVVGAANGAFTLAAAAAEGARTFCAEAPVSTAAPLALAPMRPDPALPGRQWIDYQNDVTLKDAGIAAREGFTSVEHLKRYTTLGMATDQGRTSNFAGLAAMAAITGRSIPETGTTTFRPPFEPVPLAVLGGRRRHELFNPLKRLALEDAHRAAGARFREYGGWLRPAAYGEGDETALAQQEARAARETAAIFDASPLGKLEVIGPNAASLLDFTSYVRMSTLKPGRARYGFMLSESGIVFDDGVVLRLSDDRYIVSASSSHVAGVRFAMEDARQDRLSRAGVHIHDVTAGWTTLTVSGPKAGALLAEAGVALPGMAHMDVVETTFDGAPLRAARISFTGDTSFELSVPARRGEALRARLDAARAACGGGWIGLEAVMILRAEKGYILIGKDTDGLTMPHDLGWTGPRDKRTDEYLGKRSLFTPAAAAETRRQLVGLAPDEGGAPFTTGAHLVENAASRRSLGFVTSSYFSPALGRPIALGLLERGRARIGERIGCFDNGSVRAAVVTEPCAFDPQGARLHG